MVSSLQAFNLNDIGVVRDEKDKMTAVTLYEGYLASGDEKGILSLYEPTSEKRKLDPTKTLISKDKKPIEQMVCSPCSNILYVLSKGMVTMYTLPKLEQISSQTKDTVLKIAVNQHPDYQNNLLLVTKKRKVKVVSIDFNSKGLIEEPKSKDKKDSTLEIDPEVYEWYGDLFCYANGSKAIWVNLKTGETSVHVLSLIQNIKFIQDSWLVLSEGVGIFINPKEVMQISPVSFDSSLVINYYGYKNYIIALHEHAVEIMAITPTGESSQVQMISLEDDKFTAKYFLKSQNRMIIVASNAQNMTKFCLLEEVSFETQIGLLLDSNKIDEAMNKLNDNVLSLDDRKPERIEQFFIDCAWSQIKHEKYEEAYRYAHLTRFNPFEIMYLYYFLLDIKVIHPAEVMKQIQGCVFLSDKMKKNDETMKKIYRLLINLLNKKRDFILRTYDLSKESHMNQTMEFVSSKKAIIDLSKLPMKLTVAQVFYHVNVNLLKAMIKNQDENPKKIAEIIEHPAFTTICPDDPTYDFADEIFGKESKIFVDQREIQVARAYLHERNKQYSEALDIWEKKFGHANNKTYLSEAREKTKRILLSLSESKKDRETNKGILLKYIQWMLLDEGGSTSAFEIITSSDLFTYDYFMTEVMPKVEKEYINLSGFRKAGDTPDTPTPGQTSKAEPTLNLKVKFLEYINRTNPVTKYQTLLIETYIDEVLKGVPVKDTSKELKESEMRQFFAKKKKYFDESPTYKALLECLYQENACYNKMVILDKVKNQLIEVEMFLSSALNFHRAALDRMLKEDVDDESKIFTQIEKFCSENVKKKPDLYSDLFNILADQYKTLTRSILETKKSLENIEAKPSKSNEEIKSVIDMKDLLMKSEKRLVTIKEEMLKVMISVGDFDKLDPVFVLSKIPDDWNAIADSLKLYISSVMKNYSHLVNKYKNAKSLSEMALLYKEREALQVKNKSVTIENDTNCEFCGKKIGNTIFVVYPNMKIYHSKCAPNTSICPTTGVDFTKKKLVN